MEFLTEYGLFLAKTVTFVIAFVVIVGIAVSAGMKNTKSERAEIDIEKINDRFEHYEDVMEQVVLDPEILKHERKAKKKQHKLDAKQAKKAAKAEAKANKAGAVTSTPQIATETAVDSADAQAPVAVLEAAPKNESAHKKRLFVLDFDGDVKASDTDQLRETISAVLSVAKATDEIVVRLESSGGMVHSYGLASSQLARITRRNIPLTICVDKVAASGGYMMACVANKIVCAPFAIMGSIGVVAQLPNFHRLLKKNDIDYEMLTAGEYKRTLTMFGENTDKGRQKFVEDLEDTHVLFKQFIKDNRPAVDIEAVATGEIWFGSRALEQRLVDEISTSDEYLFDRKDSHDIYEVSLVGKKSLAEKLGLAVEVGAERVLSRVIQQMSRPFVS